MDYWLCISSDYHCITIALCSTDTIIASHSIDKKFGSQRLLLDLDSLLKQHAIELSNLKAIAVNAGPAPYTSLRIALATANGLHFATGIPLIAIDALKAFALAHAPTDEQHATVVLLNAFNNELFFAIARYNRQIKTGYGQSEQTLANIEKELEGINVCYIGNGAVTNQGTDYPTMTTLAHYAWQELLAQQVTNNVLPLYLKQISAR
jgi:tRNA threonylcarbamoyladenosine biosynthesis protein TsaB